MSQANSEMSGYAALTQPTMLSFQAGAWELAEVSIPEIATVAT